MLQWISNPKSSFAAHALTDRPLAKPPVQFNGLGLAIRLPHFLDQTSDQVSGRHSPGPGHALAGPEREKFAISSLRGRRPHGSGQNVLQRVRQNCILTPFESRDEFIGEAASRPGRKTHA